MEAQYVLLLSLVVFLPAAVALLVLPFLPKERPEAVKLISLAATVAVFLLTAWMAIPRAESESSARFATGVASMQDTFSLDWISSFNIYYSMGVDGLSFPFLLLTTFISLLAMGASWKIDKHVKGYCILFLLLETGMLGVFLALDFFLFYVFWEVMLLPMYFLIGVWGGPRREYAALKFFLYTLFGSVLMLIAILMLYFNSDLTVLARVSDLRAPDAVGGATVVWSEMHLPPEVTRDVESRLAAAERGEPVTPLHTFNLLALAQIGQHTALFDTPMLFGKTLQWWAFILLFIGFAIKVPIVPLHTWLPDAHVEAPTPISMILAGVLLKMGGYGILRICYPICPDAGYDLAGVVTGIGVVSMVYGAFAALAQKDFKRLVAYSSVSHMGYVVLGIGVWSATAGTGFNSEYWAQGMNGAVFQMLAHGISSPGMFLMVGIIYERVHHRNLDEFGGLFAKMPVYSGLAFAIFFAGLGLPGLCGFIGEVFVTLSVWNYSTALAVISAATVILTAGYILWTLQRVYLGPEYRGPHGDHLYPLTARELVIAAPIVALAVVFGVYPRAILDYSSPTVTKTAEDLAHWTKTVKQPRLASEAQQEATAHLETTGATAGEPRADQAVRARPAGSAAAGGG